MKAFIRVLKDIALMLTRIIMGVIMVTHGWHRWQNEGITAEANILEHAGIPNPGLMVWLLIGLGLMVLNIGIILTLRSHTFYVHNSGWEYNAVMTIVGLVLMTHGAGRIGLDNLFRTPKDVQPQAEEQPKRPARSLPEEPARSLPEEPARSLPDEWDDTPARGIQLPQETHSKFMAKPHSGLSQ